ncbi:hypothetical protein GH714_005873 [Hevea brasiliensis]|uniref:Uncharacterized protein n=1 Tax=Hevea brasiliensis TaxID=3981 RepID=A0A6A6KK58_HEVBR|nr:hypothetical protein GH714_005873 [Hevea brasiliensis]
MATALHMRKMTDQEENPDTSRALSLIHSNSNSSSFCSITVSQPKIRIKIPKLLAKAMQEKSNGYSASANKPDRTKAKKNKWGKSTNCNFMRGKFNEIDTNSVGVGRIADIVIERQASTRSLSRLPSTGNTSDIVNLPRVPSRILTCRRNLKMSQSLTKIKSTRINEGKSSEREDRGEEELCKKRILMGEKCKPLSYSGTLE